MTIRSASATAFALIATISASAAHADAEYQPYYDTRDSLQFSDVQVPQSSGTTAVPVVANPGQAAPWQAPRDTVAGSGFLGVPQDWNSEAPLFHYNNAVSVSGGASFYNFKEEVAPVSPSVRGWLPSIAADASYMNHYNTYFALGGTDTFGNDTYHGPTAAAPRTVVDLSHHSTIYTADGKIGQGIYLAPNVMLIPYADVGYRHWRSDNNDGSQIAYFHNFSVMGGLMAQVNPIPRLFLTGFGAGGTTLGSRAERNSNSDSYTLGDSGIYDVGGKAGFFVAPRIEVFSTVDYVHFHYGQSSTASDNTIAPSSQTNQTTLRVGLGYHFR